jgi:hypothetical protein
MQAGVSVAAGRGMLPAVDSASCIGREKMRKVRKLKNTRFQLRGKIKKQSWNVYDNK